LEVVRLEAGMNSDGISPAGLGADFFHDGCGDAIAGIGLANQLENGFYHSLRASGA
jgi:hypothetical protein